MSMLPMAMYGLEVPAGDVAIPAKPDIQAAFRITMAAIDPSAEAEGDGTAPPRATLKVIRQPLDFDDDDEDSEDDDEDSFDPAEMERMLAGEGDSSESENEDLKGGPSDPAKSKKAKKEAAQKEIRKLLEQDEMDVDANPNGVNGVKSAKAKGKMPASDEEDDEDEDSSDDEGDEIEEFVLCTLDPASHYQQTLDITFGEDEAVWFKVTGTHSIYLTGNYVVPPEEHSHGEDDYDMDPDESELDYDEDSEDDLDDMEDPRITEIEEDEEAPELVQASKKDKKAAGKNKRSAPEDDSEVATTLDELIAKDGADGEKKLSKKQQKKLKKNDGAAADAPAAKETEQSSGKGDKKVSFAKELEQGPTPTKGDDKAKTSLGTKNIQGVTVEDKKLGTGQAAKNGDRVSVRYIGKLQKDNKIFDSNKKGKPFSFKLGAGEVIKGMEYGMQGLQAGGERRITIPAHLAYGKQRTGDIPPNSTLIFDLKALEVNKK